MISRVGLLLSVALPVCAASLPGQRPPKKVASPTPTVTTARYEVVVQESPVGSEPMKQLQVSCPGGRKALAAGWAVLDGTSAILDGNATYSEPTWDASGWMVNARNASSFTTTWKLRVRVVCGSGDASSGYEVAVAESAVGSEPTKQAQLSCPAGKRGLGAGWAALDGTSAILEGLATYSEPSYDASGWMANAQKLSTYAPTWKLRLREVCGTVTSASGHEVVVRETAVGSEPSKQLQASCPAGKKALGAGWAALDPTGATLEGRATYAEPAWDASGWMVNAQKLSSFASTWKLRIRMICASAG